MNYEDAKNTVQNLINDEYGYARILELTLGTDFDKDAFKKQLRAYVAEFGADEKSIEALIGEMYEAAKEVSAEYEANEDLSAKGLTP